MNDETPAEAAALLPALLGSLSAVPFLLHVQSGKVAPVYVAGGLSDLLGSATTILPGENWLSPWLHPRDAAAATLPDYAALAAGQELVALFRVIQPQGDYRWLRQVCRLHETGSADDYQIAGLLVDGTRLHEREEAELRYKNYSDLAADWYWEQDENFCFTYFSREFAEITGVSLPLTLGRTRWQGLGSLESEGVDWAGHIRTHEAHLPFRDFEYPSERGNRPIWFRVSGRPKFDEDGNFLGYVGVAAEVGAYKRAEQEALRAGIERDETRTRLTQIVDGSPVAAFVLDREHRITHWNRACENLTGVSATKALGTSEAWRYFYENERPTMADLIVSGEAGHEAGEDVDRFYANKWQRSAIIDGAFEAEGFFPNFGEAGRWLYFTAAPLRDDAGRVIGAIETLRDVTEQRQAESALNERAEALQQALKDLGNVIEHLEQTQDELVRSEKLAALGSMVAGVAHELNTPIGNSLMVASHLVETSKKMKESLKSGLKKSMLDEFLGDTDTAGDVLVRNLSKAAELVSSFKQVAVDQTSSQRRSFNLAEMVAEVVTSLGPTIKKTPYIVEQSISTNILMESFPGPLGQVVTNLINNGIIHGFDGLKTGRIRIEAEKPAEGEPVILKISDDGKGIPASVLPRIFDPFFTTKLGQGGSGLGLNIVHNIVFGILGGRISAESTPGEGSCFTLALPLSAPEQGSAATVAVKA
jgi:PAS domain S-box-containing protein